MLHDVSIKIIEDYLSLNIICLNIMKLFQSYFYHTIKIEKKSFAYTYSKKILYL